MAGLSQSMWADESHEDQKAQPSDASKHSKPKVPVWPQNNLHENAASDTLSATATTATTATIRGLESSMWADNSFDSTMYTTKKLNNTAGSQARAIRNEAVYHWFTRRYGSDPSDLSKWQKLCRDVGEAHGGSIATCRSILDLVFVNIIDFKEALESAVPVYRHESLRALQDYSWPHRVYPLVAAKGNELMEALLVHMEGDRR